MVKLLVRASTNPVVRLEPGRVAVQANGTVTAYAIQANGTLTPLFMLNLVRASHQPNNKWAAFVQFWFWGKEENLQKKPGDLRPHLTSFLFLAGDWHQRPGAPQRDEVSCSCDPQQVSHAVKKKCSSERIIEGVKRSQSDFLGFFFVTECLWPWPPVMLEIFRWEQLLYCYYSFIHLFIQDWAPAKRPVLNFIFNFLKTNFLADWPLTSTPLHPPLGQSSGQRPPNGAQTGGDTDG